MRASDLLTPMSGGLYCPPADVWIDPVRPVARALIGKEEGDVIEVMAPGGPKSYEITKVKYL
mgnify:CR=1 FL=1